MKRVLISLVLILLVIGLAAGCAKTAPAPAPTPAPTPTPTPTPAPAPVKPIVMKFTTHSAPTSGKAVMLVEEWAPRIEQATEGRVKIDFYWSETLGKVLDHWDYAVKGVCDIAFIVPTFAPGRFPLTEVADVPFVYPTEDSWKCQAITTALWDKYYAEEWSEAKVLWRYSSGGVDLITTNKPVRVMEDLKGMPLGVPGGPMTQGFQALGAVPSGVPTPEAYMALDRGAIDGYALPIFAQLAFRHHEVGKYETLVSIVAGQFCYVMNLDTWNSLSPADQKAIDEINKEWAAQRSQELTVHETEKAIEVFKERGIEVIYLTPEERARWTEATQPAVDDWTAKMDARGFPATELVNEVRRLAALPIEEIRQLAAAK